MEINLKYQKLLNESTKIESKDELIECLKTLTESLINDYEVCIKNLKSAQEDSLKAHEKIIELEKSHIADMEHFNDLYKNSIKEYEELLKKSLPSNTEYKN